MHRTTIAIEGHLENRLKKLALKERRSFKELVNDLLKRSLKSYQEDAAKHTAFSWHTSAAVAAEFFDPSNRSSYVDAISKKIS